MMVKIGKKIVKYRVVIFVLGLLLLIPSAMGYLKTRVNYDILYYLPDNIETIDVYKRQIQKRMEADRKKIDKRLTLGMNKKEVAALEKMLDRVLYNIAEP